MSPPGDDRQDAATAVLGALDVDPGAFLCGYEAGYLAGLQRGRELTLAEVPPAWWCPE